MTDEVEIEKEELDLPELEGGEDQLPVAEPTPAETTSQAGSEGDQPYEGGYSTKTEKTATDLEAVFDVPVTISAILGKTDMEVSALLRLTRGAIIELDRKVGEAIDIYVNNRLVARGEVVLVEDQLGVTMTEIIQSD